MLAVHVATLRADAELLQTSFDVDRRVALEVPRAEGLVERVKDAMKRSGW